MSFCQHGWMSERNNSFACNSMREIKDLTPPSFEGKPMHGKVGRLDKTKSVFQSCLHSTILKIPFPRLMLTSLLSNICLIVLLTFSLNVCFFMRTHDLSPPTPLSSFAYCGFSLRPIFMVSSLF